MRKRHRHRCKGHLTLVERGRDGEIRTVKRIRYRHIVHTTTRRVHENPSVYKHFIYLAGDMYPAPDSGILGTFAIVFLSRSPDPFRDHDPAIWEVWEQASHTHPDLTEYLTRYFPQPTPDEILGITTTEEGEVRNESEK